MQKTTFSSRAALAALFLALILLAAPLTACRKNDGGDLWADALYTADTTLGSGSAAVTVAVTAGDKTVTFTIRTDKATLGDALSEFSLLDGEMGEFGLYVKKLNGITADYDADQYYWGLFSDGEALMTGVDSTPVEDGARFELIRTK